MLRKNKSIILFVAAILVLSSLFISCAPAAPATQFTIRFGAFQAQDSLAYYVMADKGFATKNGIQFTDVTTASGAAATEGLVSGSLDASIIGTVSIIIAYQNGLIPGKIVPVAAVSFSDSEHQNAGVLVSKAIKSWQSLADQTIATSNINGILCASLKGRLKLEAVVGTKFVEMVMPNLGLAVASGNVAAAVIPEPYLTQSILRGDGNLLDWVIGGKPFVKMQNSDLVVSAAFYKENPAAVKALLRAYMDATKWTNQNIDDARAVLTKRLSLAVEIGQKMKMIQCPLDGRNDPVLLDYIQSVLIDIGMLKAPIPSKQLYDETLLNEVLSERR
jgi:NitT/TauT family transport system substrate-binding protein